MILVDTSVWIDHLAHGDARLQTLLEDGEVPTHPYVIGEIALGGLPRRQERLSAMQAVPAIDIASAQIVSKGSAPVKVAALANLHLAAEKSIAG